RGVSSRRCRELRVAPVLLKGRRMSRWLTLLLMLSCPSWAASPWRSPNADVRALSADPDAAMFQIIARQTGLLAKVGASIPLVGLRAAEQGFALTLPGFIELHNEHGDPSVVPYRFWRGAFALEGAYRFPGFLVSLALEHESDHPTGLTGSSLG